MPARPPVSDAARSGNRRETLVALRDRLATEIDDPDTLPRDLAALSRQITHVLQEIDALPDATKPSVIASLAKRRADRLKATGLSAS